jgi:transcriptional regulator with XRE-family HTH domain
MKPRRLDLGNKNIIGSKITKLRIERHLKQKDLLAKMQTKGININPSSLSKLEGQTRPVTDIELKVLAEIFSVSVDELLNDRRNNL